MFLDEKAFNELIDEVSQEFASLQKSEAAMKKDADLEEADAAPSEEAPAAEDAALDAELSAPSEEPALDAAPEEEAVADQIDQSAEQDPNAALLQELDALLSEADESLLQSIYELLMSKLEGVWSQEDQVAPEADAAPAPEMDAEMGKGEYPTDKDANGGEIRAGAKMAKEEKEASEECEEEESEEEIKKAQKENEALKKHIAELESSLGNLVKTMESKLPARKSITEISTEDSQVEISEADLKKSARSLITRRDLTKSERSMMNSFFINGSFEEQVRELVKAKKA